MSAASVLSPMSGLGHCPYTGLTIPECSCPPCTRALLQCYAPAPPPSAARVRGSASATICTVEDYAGLRGLSVAQLHRCSRSQEVRI